MVRRFAQLTANVALALVSVLATVTLVEGSARWFLTPIPFSLYPSPDNCLQRSRLLSQEFRSRCTGSLAATDFHTNGIGLRGDEVRDDASIRVLAIGDSCTWGWRVGEDETYPSRLQQLLDYRWGAGRYQVINAGVPGYTSYQGLLYLRERGLRLRPALVLVAYGFNDASPGGDVEALIARQARMLPLLQLDDWLIYNSRLYGRARWNVWYHQKPSPVPEERVAPEKYEVNLKQIVSVAREHGVAVVFVGFAAGFKNDSARKRVAEEQQVPFIRYVGPKLDLVHPTAEGYRDLAARVLDRITETGMLDTLKQPTLNRADAT